MRPPESFGINTSRLSGTIAKQPRSSILCLQELVNHDARICVIQVFEMLPRHFKHNHEIEKYYFTIL